jgi:2-oxoglutarate ferredoxin oxidoreductase subunit alpha
MVRLRDKKIRKIADFVDDPEISGESDGDLLVISWGSTYGAIFTAIEEIRSRGLKVSWYHLRWIHPLPKNLGGYIKSFNKVLIPEINLGQLIKIIRSEYLVDAKGFNSVRGLPLRVSDIIEAIETQLKG